MTCGLAPVPGPGLGEPCSTQHFPSKSHFSFLQHPSHFFLNMEKKCTDWFTNKTFTVKVANWRGHCRPLYDQYVHICERQIFSEVVHRVKCPRAHAYSTTTVHCAVETAKLCKYVFFEERFTCSLLELHLLTLKMVKFAVTEKKSFF